MFVTVLQILDILICFISNTFGFLFKTILSFTRRHQSDEERVSDDQLVERQKNFAKASLARYFSSLENAYTPPTDISQTESIPEEQPRGTTQLGDLELESLTSERNMSENVAMQTSKNASYAKNVTDDAVNAMFNAGEPDTFDTEVDLKEHKTEGNGYNPYVYGFVDFTESLEPHTARSDNKDENTKQSPQNSELDNEKNDLDEQTVVESTANTDFTLNAGGITDRLNDLGIEISHVMGTIEEKVKVEKKGTPDDKKNTRKGKVLIVCPECDGLNKQYMSWCTQCGEMIIGVEPMLVSKNKEGKIRTRPLEKNEKGSEKLIDKTPKDSSLDMFLSDSNTVSVNYAQEIIEKPFTLNLDEIKSADKEEEEVNAMKKWSPNKSDGKDSGRPSSGDVDLELQSQKIEEEVVNDICALISDPDVKGIVKSHLNKSKNFQQENSVDKVSQGWQLETENRKFIDDFNEHGSSSKITGEGNYYLDGEGEVDFDYRQENNTYDSVHDKVAMYNDNNYNNKRDLSAPSTSYHSETQVNENATVKSAQKSKPKKKHASKKRSKGSPSKESKLSDILSDSDDELFAPPPVPNFSEALPALHNELALKLPANSMEWSTDVSQIVSQNFEQNNAAGKTEESKLSKEERRRERRRKRGHGAIDVEVFGYEETRESRNSSRANRMVPMLNLRGK